MFEQQFFEKIARSPVMFTIYNALVIIFTTGITFTFVIPGLKYFSPMQLAIALIMYFFVACIFVALYPHNFKKVFFFTLFWSALGLLWRVILEWGESSLEQVMEPAILIGYPIVIAIIVTFLYGYIQRVAEQKKQLD